MCFKYNQRYRKDWLPKPILVYALRWAYRGLGIFGFYLCFLWSYLKSKVYNFFLQSIDSWSLLH